MTINAQNELGLDASLQAQTTTKVHQKQLVSESADQTEDNQEDL